MKRLGIMERFMEKTLRAKEARRRKLARLTFPEKIEILLRLQRIATGVQDATGRKGPRPWA